MIEEIGWVGILDVMVIQIVKCVGVLIVLVYYYFGFKDKIFMVVMCYVLLVYGVEVWGVLLMLDMFQQWVEVIVWVFFLINNFRKEVFLVWFNFYVVV